MVGFLVGLVVGASAVALLIIVIAPSRKVRSEPRVDREAETRLLLGRDPDDRTMPPSIDPDHDQAFSPQDIAQLRKLGQQSSRRRSR